MVIVVLLLLMVVGVQEPLREVVDQPRRPSLLHLQHLAEPFTIPGNVLAQVRQLARLEQVLLSVPCVQLALPEAPLDVDVILMLLLLLRNQLLAPYLFLKSPLEIFYVLFELLDIVSLSSEKFFYLLFHFLLKIGACFAFVALHVLD